mgnify:CR=1 FL=1
MSRNSIFTFTEKGLYCPAGDFFIDPSRPVERALITHGHADHARRGMTFYLATHDALPVIRHRLGNIQAQGIHYGEVQQIGGARVSFHPAGHVPGSAQIRVEVGGEVLVASGDYKIVDDGISAAFEPIQCHHFITESTFGLPIFRWESQACVAAEINAWWAQCVAAGKTAFLGAYSLGKAQRLMSMLDPNIGPILTHASIESTNEILRDQGFKLPDTRLAQDGSTHKGFSGAIVIAPPSALTGEWADQFGPRETGFASGWMAVRKMRRSRAACDRSFVISDHADWDGLLWAISQTESENIYVTHGYTENLTRYLNESGWRARVVPSKFKKGNHAESEGI